MGEIWGQSWRMEAGLHCVSAPSGRGKTSVLRMISGMLDIQPASIHLDPEPSGRRWSILDQALSCLGELSARENLELGLPDGEWVRGAVHADARRLGIDGILDQACSRISRGELQRVLFLRTISQEAAWYLLDEPFSHVGSDWAAIMLEMCRQRCCSGRGVIITSLDPAEPDCLAAPDVRVWRL